MSFGRRVVSVAAHVRDRRSRLPRRDRAAAPRARGPLLPDARLRPGRRGPRAGDVPGRLARAGRLRRPRLPAHLAVPDRDEPLPERAARRLAPAGRGRAARRTRPSPRGWARSCGCSRSRTSSTRRARRSGSRSSPASSTSRPRSAPRSSSRTCSGSAPRRSRTCSRRRPPPSTAACNGRERRSRRGSPRPTAHPPRARPPNARSSTRFADAFQAGDVDAIVALLTDDAWLTMPPAPLEYQGPEAIGRFLSTVPAARRPAALPARPDARERPARVRPLPARPPDRARASGSSSSRSPASG